MLLVVGHQRQVSSYDAAVLYYGLGMAFLAIIAPLLPYLLGITALFVRYVPFFLLLRLVDLEQVTLNCTKLSWCGHLSSFINCNKFVSAVNISC